MKGKKKRYERKVLSHKQVVLMQGNGIAAADVKIEKWGSKKHEVGAHLGLTVSHFGNTSEMSIHLSYAFVEILIDQLKEARDALKESFKKNSDGFYDGSEELVDLTKKGEPQIPHKLAPMKKYCSGSKGGVAFSGLEEVRPIKIRKEKKGKDETFIKTLDRLAGEKHKKSKKGAVCTRSFFDTGFSSTNKKK